MSDFALILNDMRAHYKKNLGSGKRQRYLPSEKKHQVLFFAAVPDNLNAESSDAIEQLKFTSQVSATDTSTGIQDGITVATGELKDKGASQPAIDDFKRKMEEQRKAAKENAGKNIDKIYDEAISIGEKHPASQTAILNLMDTVSQLFDDLVSKLVDYVVGIVKSVVEWLTKAWESIRSFFSGVGSWISSWF
ncbi:hypothetical protein [Pectobacterium jejuense]|uniref:Uncharacterized protein n=1 Tax=Pectobacterium jejuense TaxID=2974022 RepID=A0ABW8GSY9_9GAMM